MLTLIVALASPAPGKEYSFALSRDALPRLVHEGPEASSHDTLKGQGCAPLATLPAADEIVAVVPGHRLSWHRIVLPKANSARLRSALDGLLEERLLDEPQSMHFALAPGAVSGKEVWLAACHKGWLSTALQAFELAGRRVTRVVPEYVPPLADQPTTVHAIGSAELPWLVRCATDGVQTVPMSDRAWAALQLEGFTGLLTAEPAVAELAEKIAGRSVRILHSAPGLELAARSPWDLAQFELTSNSSTRTARRAARIWAQWASSVAWRPARWGLAALVIAQGIGLNVWAWKERATLNAKRAEITQILNQTFPKVSFVVNASLQMEREVALLRQATGAIAAGDLEFMLAAVAQSVQTAKPPTAIDFTADTLTLKGFELTPIQMTELTQGLARAGYSGQQVGDSFQVKTSVHTEPQSAVRTEPLKP